MVYQTCVSTTTALWIRVKRPRPSHQPARAIGSVGFKLTFSLELLFCSYIVFSNLVGFYYMLLRVLNEAGTFHGKLTVGGRTHFNFLKGKRLKG